MSAARSIWSIAVAGICAGCGSGDEPPDGGTPARCDLSKKFATKTGLAALNTMSNDEQAALSPDELTVYFSRDGGATGYDIYQATRGSKGAPFASVAPVMDVNTAADERYPRVTADGMTMFATTKATSESQFRVARAKRASTSAAFGALEVVPEINGTTNDTDPFISADGRVLYFASDRGGNYGLYRSVLSGAVFSTPQLVPGSNLDTTYTEATPVASEDELTLYFVSSRPLGQGSIDIYQATRATMQDPFGDPVAVVELNTLDGELPSWLSADGCELYFTRFNPAQGLELAVALRPR